MSLVKKYRAEVVKLISQVEGIYTVEFGSIDDKEFKYKPGQFLHLTIDEYDGIGQWPESRCFSMQSSPDRDVIIITYAVKGKYTSRMEKQLKVGTQVYLKLPYGDLFIQNHNKENTVFIAGGTGITPFLSLMNDLNFAAYTNPILLFGLKNKTYNIYDNELKKAMDINPSLSITMFYENENGLIDINNFFINARFNDSIFFISGPPVMIKYYKQLLISNDVNTSDIRTDEWE